ncbi:hypothetical protein ZIOFF_017171 [Zingiber officinale]|uniref:Uncharacterized protein n=1 Tax=Zingiber officinale TaxID=94328 RepID=A0A8J5LL44_ZINOF|nr:hypothetical protein ZIOFF_017171 [Zingiber officinale]
MTPNGAIRFVALLLATKARSYRSSSTILHRSLQRRLSHFSVAPVATSPSFSMPYKLLVRCLHKPLPPLLWWTFASEARIDAAVSLPPSLSRIDSPDKGDAWLPNLTTRAHSHPTPAKISLPQALSAYVSFVVLEPDPTSTGIMGFARFVNVGDERGETPLHLAARRRWTECVRVLLDHGALVSSSTREYGHSGSTPLHLAARGGSLDCVRILLAWGADQLQRDSSGRIPYSVAIKHNHGACAALLNPSAAEPLVWPSPLKFISELDPDARALLEVALMDANKESNKIILNERKNCCLLQMWMKHFMMMLLRLVDLAAPHRLWYLRANYLQGNIPSEIGELGHNSSIYWLSEPIMISLLQLNSAYLIAKGNLYTRSREDAATSTAVPANADLLYARALSVTSRTLDSVSGQPFFIHQLPTGGKKGTGSVTFAGASCNCEKQD